MFLQLDFSIFPNSWKRLKIEIFEYQLRLHFQIFSNSLNIWEIGIFDVSLFSDKDFGQSICDGQGSQSWILIYATIFWQFEGYLSYRNMTSLIVSFEAQVKKFFIWYKGYVPFSRYSSLYIFNHLMIYQIWDVIMSISS